MKLVIIKDGKEICNLTEGNDPYLHIEGIQYNAETGWITITYSDGTGAVLKELVFEQYDSVEFFNPLKSRLVSEDEKSK